MFTCVMLHCYCERTFTVTLSRSEEPALNKVKGSQGQILRFLRIIMPIAIGITMYENTRGR